jgi:hypothetical protein
MVRRLESEPQVWGDPERRLNHPGGKVYHALAPPLFVLYAVYEQERLVCILDIKPLPSSPLDPP